MINYERKIDDLKMLRVLIELNQLHIGDEDIFKTASGRDIFYGISASFINKSYAKKANLKAITSVVSDRALRTRLREFQRLGLLRVIANASDGRVRIIDPTQIFVDHVNKKLSDLSVILKKHFYLIEKN